MILFVFTILIAIVISGFHNIGPLHSLSTGCQAGRTKVVDNSSGEKPGPYDYECH
jgi:hypothetical protein